MGAFAGVDWGCGSHAVCVIDAKGQVLDRFRSETYSRLADAVPLAADRDQRS